MPIYQYQCSDCGHSLEALQKISDSPLTHCNECGNQGLKKQVTAAAFKLKGSGWYETDFKNSGKKEKPKKEAKSSSASSKSENKVASSA